jgi:hypothetical protein
MLSKCRDLWYLLVKSVLVLFEEQVLFCYWEKVSTFQCIFWLSQGLHLFFHVCFGLNENKIVVKHFLKRFCSFQNAGFFNIVLKKSSIPTE